jgi:hypothetical protein
MSGDGMRVVGVIKSVELRTIPSKIAGEPPRPVTRVKLDLEDARTAGGREVDRLTLIGLPFEGPPELHDRLREGERVRIVTTTPSGTHIASIEPAPLE